MGRIPRLRVPCESRMYFLTHPPFFYKLNGGLLVDDEIDMHAQKGSIEAEDNQIDKRKDNFGIEYSFIFLHHFLLFDLKQMGNVDG